MTLVIIYDCQAFIRLATEVHRIVPLAFYFYCVQGNTYLKLFEEGQGRYDIYKGSLIYLRVVCTVADLIKHFTIVIYNSRVVPTRKLPKLR